MSNLIVNEEEAKIVRDYEGLIYSIINKYKKYFDCDDLYQEGAIGIIEAYRNFVPNNGYICCKMRMIPIPLINPDKTG